MTAPAALPAPDLHTRQWWLAELHRVEANPDPAQQVVVVTLGAKTLRYTARQVRAAFVRLAARQAAQA